MQIKKIKVGMLRTNCYLIIENNNCLIVDPGDNKKLIEEELNDLNVIGVLITHHHFDHTGELNYILNKYNCRLFDAKDYIDDEKIINIGNFKFKMVHTPGHKEDCISYYFYNENFMLTGDFLFNGTVGRCDLPGSNVLNMINSIKKIKNYPEKIKIYPGHGINSVLGNEIKSNIYFRDEDIK